MKITVRIYQKAKGALAERFQQILDEQVSHLGTSVIDRDPTLKRIYEKYHSAGGNEAQKNEDEEAKFRQKYQKEIGYMQSEKLLRSRHDKDLADTIINPPWTGTERPSDTALRMLMDSVPKAKTISPKKTILTPPLPASDRIKNAKDSSLDYKVTKNTSNVDKDDNFREMYKERLMGPSMFVDATSSRATLGLIGTMADARINAAIDQKTGKFETGDMASVRGKPLDRERLANSTDTNFFINEILNKQDCLPPWIESQQGAERDVQAFRLDLQRKWFNMIIARLSKDFRLKDEVLAFLEGKETLGNDLSMDNLMPGFNTTHSRYVTAKVADLNQAIRSYNLQCPSSSLHKWKLVEKNELRKLYYHVVENIRPLVEQWFSTQTKNRRIDPKSKGSSDSLLGVFDSAKGTLSLGTGSEYNVIERPQELLQFWKLVKNMFKA